MKTILAIDPSLTNTAAIVGNGEAMDLQSFGSNASGTDVISRMIRFTMQVREFEEFVRRIHIESVYIEGYSFASKGGSITSICEYGGLLRAMLIHHAERIYEVAPSTLKKFCTGKGNGNKDMVAAHLTKRYGVMFDNNDEFDAYGLYRLGLVAEGIEEAQNQQQREAVDTVLGRGTPKRKKKAS